ncbi:MAG TPA: phosphoglycerate dehydrogenase [Methylomirabilota bacterium]|nr:phosphoglycerate dehydrogenase [Methylomirabilota bacterium]
MKIIVADPISERGIELLRQPGWEVVRTTKETLNAELAAAEALVVRSATRVTAELIERAPKLLVVGRAGVGVDNVDLDAATRRGILVMNTPGGNAPSVAEHTVALLLALARRIPMLDSAMHAGRWEKSKGIGTELRGKTLGLIGMGRVGSEVARRARSLEMKVLACDPYLTESAASEAGVSLVPLDELFAQSDYITLHTALVPETQRIINAQSLAKMKKGAQLVNTARGELVDEAALADALRSGQLGGAALDVFAVEPPKDSPLLAMPNVVATPHVGGSTVEAQEEVGTLIAQQVRDYLSSGIVRNAVNLPSLTAEQYRRVQPYLSLAERLGSMIAQVIAARGTRLECVRVAFAGEPAELGTRVLRSAVLAGVLNAALAEKVNLVSAESIASTRGLVVEERAGRREHGFPDTIEVTGETTASRTSSEPSRGSFSAEGTILEGASPRLLRVDGMALEAPLEGTLLLIRNRDVPGAIGKVGTLLGSLGMNIATYALGRRAPVPEAEAISVVRIDGEVPDSILAPLMEIAALTEARLIRLPT